MNKKEVRGKKSQFSMEYVMMMGFTLLLLMPTIIIFATEQNNIKSDIAASHATQIARKLAEKSEEMFYQGAPSRTTIKISIPHGVENITFQNQDVVVGFRNQENVLNEIIESTSVNITGFIDVKNSGVYFIQIKAEGDYVNVTQV